MLDCADRRIDQARAVQDRPHGDVRRQAGGDPLQALVHTGGDGATVLAGQHQGRADHDLAAVLAGRAKAGGMANGHGGDVRDLYDRATPTTDRRVGQFRQAFDAGVGANDVGLAAALDIAGAGDAVRVLQGFDQLRQADAARGQLGRVWPDGVLLDVAAQHVDPGHALKRLELGRDDPVLDRAQIGGLLDIGPQGLALGRDIGNAGAGGRAFELDGPDIDFAQACDRRPHAGLEPVRQVRTCGLQALVDQAAREIEVGVVAEDGRDLREAVARERAGFD